MQGADLFYSPKRWSPYGHRAPAPTQSYVFPIIHQTSFFFFLPNLQTTLHSQSFSIWHGICPESDWFQKQHIRTFLNKPFKINNNSDSSAKSLCTFFPSFSSEYCLLDRCALVEVANCRLNASHLCGGNYSHFSYIWCNTLLSQSLFGLTLTVVTGYDLKSPKSCL